MELPWKMCPPPKSSFRPSEKKPVPRKCFFKVCVFSTPRKVRWKMCNPGKNCCLPCEKHLFHGRLFSNCVSFSTEKHLSPRRFPATGAKPPVMSHAGVWMVRKAFRLEDLAKGGLGVSTHPQESHFSGRQKNESP